MSEGTTRKFRYPGTLKQYLRQAFVNWSLAAGLCLALFTIVFLVDRALLGREYIQPFHLAALALLVTVWGLLLVQMAFAFARFEVETDDTGLMVRRSGRIESTPFSSIESVDTIPRPMWWAMKTDLKPLSETSRVMIRVHRKGKPPLTFAAGLEGEERLLELLREQCQVSGV